ncbi:MAG: hypothetical protein A4E65_02850 [Syntrophorhabdus sp. PtaU1.Bin153]|nr:MAG: hypothetical protein A4E65_02850 [Syntrophorhabdus sp. PtaU1.Bin153]
MSFREKTDLGTQHSTGRRQFLRSGACLVAVGASALLSSRATSAQNIAPKVWNPPFNGSNDPYPIPWLDKNGSHNQSPGPDMEPSSIYHFKGHVARCNNFTGMGTDNKGNRISFGAPSTDFSFMYGGYFAGRVPHSGAFAHI